MAARIGESQRSGERQAGSFFKLENEVMESAAAAAVAERPIDGMGGEKEGRWGRAGGPRGHLNFQRASETK